MLPLPLCPFGELIDCSPPGGSLCTGLTPGDVVVDVGLNTGSHFTLCSPEQVKGVGIVAFEPLPSLCRKAKRNARRWVKTLGLAFFDVRCKAISDRRGTATIYVPQNLTAAASLVSAKAAGLLGDAVVPLNVSMTTLDEALAGGRYYMNRVRALKTDTQGHEAAVLRGARRLLFGGGVRKLQAELDPELLEQGGSSAKELLALARHAGFNCGYERRAFECAALPGTAGARRCWNDLYCTRSRRDFCERSWLAPFRTNAVWPMVPRSCAPLDLAPFHVAPK
jgi:FkbM family methyltransferase